eukprot:scaffold15210_cov157-Isochrysis_galbana.AAC.3
MTEHPCVSNGIYATPGLALCAALAAPRTTSTPHIIQYPGSSIIISLATSFMFSWRIPSRSLSCISLAVSVSLSPHGRNKVLRKKSVRTFADSLSDFAFSYFQNDIFHDRQRTERRSDRRLCVQAGACPHSHASHCATRPPPSSSSSSGSYHSTMLRPSNLASRVRRMAGCFAARYSMNCS